MGAVKLKAEIWMQTHCPWFSVCCGCLLFCWFVCLLLFLSEVVISLELESKGQQSPSSQTHLAKNQVSLGMVPALGRLREEGGHKCEGDGLAYGMRP